MLLIYGYGGTVRARHKPLPDRTTPMSVISLDIGHSAVKVAADEHQFLFPTAAAVATDLTVSEAQAAAKIDTVVLGDKTYFVGETAVTHTGDGVLDGLSDDWIHTQEHLALMKSGYERALQATGDSSADVVLGLPSRLFGAQAKELAALASQWLQVPPNKIKVLPQALGAFMAMMLDADGVPLEGASPQSETWGVIDIGFYTADYGMIVNGVWSEAGAKSSEGASSIVGAIQTNIQQKHGVPLTLRQCDEVLRTKALKLFGKVENYADVVDQACANYARNVIEAAAKVFGSRLPTMDGILVAGGAAALVYPHIVKQWPHARISASPRYTVAEGMRRYVVMVKSVQAGQPSASGAKKRTSAAEKAAAV